MKRNLLLTTLTALSFTTALIAQESVSIDPYSKQINLADYENGLNAVVLPAIDLTAVMAEDLEREKQAEFERFAISIPVDLSLNNAGVWSQLPNGDKIWRMKVTCTGALATIFYFNDFYMPQGARMHVYNEDQSQIIGAFTSYNNHESGVFSTDNINGETAIIEYYEPAAQSGRGRIQITEVGYAYRHIYRAEEEELQQRIDESDACEIDVACPEGTNWPDQIKATVRIRVKVGASFGFCSGTVVNNTGLDCTPYVLTAWHCGEGASAADFNSWIMYFKFQKNACGSGTATSSSMTGCTMRANSNDGGGNTGSDFLLVEMNNFIPTTNVPFFCGWDATGYSTGNTTDGVGIHHPAGDCKKISTYTSNVNSTSWGGSVANTHWRIVWAATVTDHGVTEGGSSGSGIFRADNGGIWGTLTGGSSFCTSPNAPDLYGKLAYSWTSNGTTANRQLKPWLDPINSGALTLTGNYYPCVNAIEEHDLATMISLYPNPSTGIINVSVAEDNVDALTITVHNIIGEVVFTGKIPSGTTTYTIDLGNEANGIYLVTVTSPVNSVSKKVIVE